MQPILHHYPPSLFSEKIRVLLGYLDLSWHSVIIPPIMPRPDLMPLSGGYRKTPIMQVGANIYCDSAIICPQLAKMANNETLYKHGFTADRIARWADTELFRTTVALNFRPEAIAAQMSQMSEAEMAAFAKDRAELSGSDQIVSVDPAAAEAHFRELLISLDQSLDKDFLLDDAPSIADFSIYHCLWFVSGNPVNSFLFDDYPKVRAYLSRMAQFGHGKATDMPSAEALKLGTEAAPVYPAGAQVDSLLAADIVAGDTVAVSPDDYGRFAVSGELIAWQPQEIVIQRNDPSAGELLVHFPNIGFTVSRA